MGQYINLKVKKVVQETPNAVSLHFKQPLFKKVKYQPGQYLTLIFQVNGKEERRCYSLSSAPQIDDQLAVTVKRVEGGLISNHICDSVKVGESIKMMPPMGRFALDDASQRDQVIFFAGGSGVTPMMSMLKTVLKKENTPVLFVYANRDEKNIIFRKQLEEIEKKANGQLKIAHILSEPSSAWTGRKGMLSGESLNDILADYTDGKRTSAFMCGPEGMMEAVKTYLGESRPSWNVYLESFVLSESSNDATDELSKEQIDGAVGAVKAPMSQVSKQNVTLVYGGETYQVDVPKNKSILDAGLDAGIDMPFSCQNGLCTACMSTCTSGTVTMGGNDLLTDDEIAKGLVLTCVSHPLTDDVKIEVGL